MIFKTIKDDATGAVKGISIFNSSIEDMKKNLSNGQGFFYSIFQGNKLNKNDIQGIQNYISAIDSGVNPSQALKDNLLGCSVAAQKWAENATEANMTTKQMSDGLKNASKVGSGFKGVITGIGTTFLNSLVGAGIGIAVNGIITLITKLVNAEQEARQKAVENAKAYENQKTELESLKQKYIEIMDSEMDEATKAQELDSIKQTLAKTYGVEKEALDKLNESRKEGLKLLDDEAIKNADDVINKNQADYNRYSKEAMDTETSNTNGFYRRTGKDGTYSEFNAQINKIIGDLSKNGIVATNKMYASSPDIRKLSLTYGKNAYAAYENIQKALSELSEKERTYGLNEIEQIVIETLRNDATKLDNYLYNSDTGIDNIMSSTADAYWTKYAADFEKAGNKAFDNIDTLDGLEQWEKGFIKSLGEFANDPYFSQYIEKIFDDKKEEIQKAANQTEQSIKFPTVNVTELNEKLEKTSEKLEKITTSASKVQSALKSAFSKENFSVDDVLELIELMPDIADKFKMNDDGTFSIDYKDLQSGAEAYVATQKEEIDTTNKLIKAKISELEANIALNKSKLPTKIKNQYEAEYYQGLKNAIETDESNLSDLKAQLSEGLIKSEFLAKSAEDLSSSFSAVVDVLTNRYEVIADVEDAIAENGSISLDILNNIKEVYPELSNEVSNYMMGLIDEQSLLNKLKDTYDDDFYEYRDAIAQKIDLTDEELQSYLDALNTKYAEDRDYYTHLGATSKNFIDYMKDNYDVDLKNCSTWLAAKRKMHDEYISKIETAGLGLNIEDYYDFDNAKWKDGAEQQLAQIQANSPKEFSDVMAKVYAVLDDYKQGAEEFGKLFKSANTLDGVSKNTGKSNKSTTNEVFDWIEVRLNRLADKTKSFFDKVSEYISNSTNEKNLAKAINSTQKEIDANKTAEQKYLAKANSINLSESWKKKVREGNFSIDELTDETLIKNIQDYQKWWEKAKESSKNIYTLTEQKKDYLSQQFDSKYERQQRVTDRYTTANDKINDRINYKEAKGKKVTASDYNNLNKNLSGQNKSLYIQNQLLIDQQKTVEKGSAKWQEYQDEINKNSQTIRQNTVTIAENNKKIDNLKIADYSNKANTYGRKVEIKQNQINLREAQGYKVGASAYQYLIDNTEKENETLRNQRAYIQELQGETEVGSDLWLEYQGQLEEINDKLYNNRIQQAEWNAQIRDMPIEKLQSYLDLVDSIKSTVRSEVEMMEYIYGESSITANDILKQQYSQKDLDTQWDIVNEANKLYADAKRDGRAEDMEKYQKMANEAEQSYYDMLKTNEELFRRARDVTLYRGYEQDLQHIEDIKKALNSLEGMLNDEALFNDDGSFSNQGIAKVALTVNQLEQARASAANYQKQIDELYANYDKYNSEDEFNEKVRELTDGYQSATAEVNQYTEAIKDLYKNQAQEELNVLNELIDTRQEALEKKKSYYDYDRTIRNKTKDITAMQMQIEALNGVSTAEAKAQKALLQEQLNGLEEDLADTQAEHIYQVQIDGLNEQKEILQDIYDTFIDSLNKCLDTEQEIISSATYLAVNSVQTVQSLLYDIAKARGYTIDPVYMSNNNTLPHFANGGLVESKGKDDGLAWLKAGEYVLNENAFKAFKYTLPIIDNLADKMHTMIKSMDSAEKPVSIGDVQLIVQGNVDKNVMDDLKKYQKQIADSVITNITKDLRKVGYKR